MEYSLFEKSYKKARLLLLIQIIFWVVLLIFQGLNLFIMNSFPFATGLLYWAICGVVLTAGSSLRIMFISRSEEDIPSIGVIILKYSTAIWIVFGLILVSLLLTTWLF